MAWECPRNKNSNQCETGAIGETDLPSPTINFAHTFSALSVFTARLTH